MYAIIIHFNMRAMLTKLLILVFIAIDIRNYLYTLYSVQFDVNSSQMRKKLSLAWESLYYKLLHILTKPTQFTVIVPVLHLTYALHFKTLNHEPGGQWPRVSAIHVWITVSDWQASLLVLNVSDIWVKWHGSNWCIP